MKWLGITAVFVLFLPICTHAEELNAGFVQGLWYSEEAIFVNEPVRIYAALRNNTEHDLSGTVRFSVDGKQIGVSVVSALPGRLIEAWADWIPTYGEHTITATLSDVKLHIVGEGTENIEVVSPLAEDTVTIDYDTDGDGIGNKEDADDDDDGIPDEEEIDNGTDPLVYTGTDEEPKETEEPDVEDETEETEEFDQQPEKGMQSASSEGLERYFDEGRVNNVLSSVTEKVYEVKSTLDTYREKRNTEREQEKQDETTDEVVAEFTLDDSSTSTLQSPEGSGELATITRTKADEGPGFVASLVAGVGAVISGAYTFVLWALSGILAYPALVQLIILFGILFGIYKLARKFGKRPN